MSALWLLLLAPVVTGLLLATPVGRSPQAGHINSAGSLLALLASLALAAQLMDQPTLSAPGFQLDALNTPLIVLTAFIGFTTAIFSRSYMGQMLAEGRVSAERMRLYYGMFQAFMLTMLLALSTNNLGILWVSVEGATLATVLLVSLYRTPESIEAAWKYFILCGVGIALALFGTVLIYFAAQQIAPQMSEAGTVEGSGLNWQQLSTIASALEPRVMAIAFVFALVGYGTKIGLVPMHQWLPDAHSEGPTPMSAMLSGLLLNIALYALLRIKVLVDGSLSGSDTPMLAGQLLMGFGLVSFLVATLFLHRQRDIKRLFSYSSIEHMGLMSFAFGLGGPLASFGALVHMFAHSLTKSAIFVTVGQATHIAGSQNMDQIRGLIRSQPAVGWTLLIAVAAIAGFPPFGVFSAEFILLNATLQAQPWLTIPLIIGLGIAFAGLFRHLQPMVFGSPPAQQHIGRVNILPQLVHLALVLWLGLAIPSSLTHWLNAASHILSGHVLGSQVLSTGGLL